MSSPVCVLGAAQNDNGQRIAAEAKEPDDAERHPLQPELGPIKDRVPVREQLVATLAICQLSAAGELERLVSHLDQVLDTLNNVFKVAEIFF